MNSEWAIFLYIVGFLYKLKALYQLFDYTKFIVHRLLRYVGLHYNFGVIVYSTRMLAIIILIADLPRIGTKW